MSSIDCLPKQVVPDDIDIGFYADSDEEGDIEELAESPERYQPGLYYPICIGEVLIQRYRIEHKISHGGLSVVWMAYDM